MRKTPSIFLSILSAILILIPSGSIFGQSDQQDSPIKVMFEKQNSGTDASMRGLSVVNNDVVWASGAGATILKTTDGGKNWVKCKFPGDQKVDFRDVHGFDKDNAIVMTAGQPAEFWRTEDGGKNWNRVFQDKREASFYDSIVFFSDGKTGIGFSDPIDGHLQIVRTEDAGRTWNFVIKQEGTKVPDGTGGFAASGTCLCTFGKGKVAIALGGKIQEKDSQSQILLSSDFGKTWKRLLCPIPADKAAGVFSIASDNKGRLVVVGGDYVQWKKKDHIAAVSDDAGATWAVVKNGPLGFRSGVDSTTINLDSKQKSTLWMAAGTSGYDYSISPNKDWISSKKENMHTIQFVPSASFRPSSKTQLQTGYSTGPEGKIFKIKIQK